MVSTYLYTHTGSLGTVCHSRQKFYPLNLGEISNEQEERFRQDIKVNGAALPRFVRWFYDGRILLDVLPGRHRNQVMEVNYILIAKGMFVIMFYVLDLRVSTKPTVVTHYIVHCIP